MRRQKRFHWIAEVIKKYDFSIVVEVGAATGMTTEFLLAKCPTLQRLTVVDLWEAIPGSSYWDRNDMEEVFRNKFEKESKVSILKGVSWEQAVNIEDKSVDLVFIDASHDYNSVIKDIKAWMPKIKKGGILCGHDIQFPGVFKATRELIGSSLRFVGFDNMWFVKL
jgi:predicted O-methyltransferase YrrM